jgi:hypothetical protein
MPPTDNSERPSCRPRSHCLAGPTSGGQRSRKRQHWGRPMKRLSSNSVARTVTSAMSGHVLAVSLALVSVIITSSAAAAACDMSQRADVQVIAKPESVALATEFSLEQINRLARDTGYVGKGPRLGFYVGTFLDTVSATVEVGPETPCTRHIRIEVDMSLVGRRIEIGRELRQRLCLFSAALQHYKKKANADEGAFAQYVESTAAMLRATPLPAVDIRPDGRLDGESRRQLEQWVKKRLGQSLTAFREARITAQQAIDTPEEIGRLTQSCTPNTRSRSPDEEAPETLGLHL